MLFLLLLLWLNQSTEDQPLPIPWKAFWHLWKSRALTKQPGPSSFFPYSLPYDNPNKMVTIDWFWGNLQAPNGSSPQDFLPVLRLEREILIANAWPVLVVWREFTLCLLQYGFPVWKQRGDPLGSPSPACLPRVVTHQTMWHCSRGSHLRYTWHLSNPATWSSPGEV